MTRYTSIILLGAALLVGCKPASKTAGTTLTLAVASSVQFAMEDLINAYNTAHPEVAVKTTYGSSGNFFAQIQN